MRAQIAYNNSTPEFVEKRRRKHTYDHKRPKRGGCKEWFLRRCTGKRIAKRWKSKYHDHRIQNLRVRYHENGKQLSSNK
jgi:hypothetical protein